MMKIGVKEAERNGRKNIRLGRKEKKKGKVLEEKGGERKERRKREDSTDREKEREEG